VTASNRNDARRERKARARLREKFEAGRMLSAGCDAPGRPNVRVLVSIQRTHDGAAKLDYEYYRSGDWDHTLERGSTEFPDLATVLEHLDVQLGIQWNELEDERAGS
jgi:hypothetical protein